MSDECDTLWGSHGCALTPGHDGDHECRSDTGAGPCSQARELPDGSDQIRAYLGDREWSDWCAPDVRIFRLSE